jgi:hypothetical protein
LQRRHQRLDGKTQAGVEGEMSIDLKPAVMKAIDYVQSLIGNVRDVRLEEVEQTENGSGLLVTISFLQPENGEINPIVAFMGGSKRSYKQVEIDSNGEPIAMRIRKIE